MWIHFLVSLNGRKKIISLQCGIKDLYCRSIADHKWVLTGRKCVLITLTYIQYHLSHNMMNHNICIRQIQMHVKKMSSPNSFLTLIHLKNHLSFYSGSWYAKAPLPCVAVQYIILGQTDLWFFLSVTSCCQSIIFRYEQVQNWILHE